MGQQQILLIVLSVILVGIAIAVGITMFRAQARQGNIDAMISDLNNLGSVAYQYRIRPVTMGGGGGSYQSGAFEEDAGGDPVWVPSGEDFSDYFLTLPEGMRFNQNAIYYVETVEPDLVVIRAESVTQKEADNEPVKRWITVGPDGLLNILVTEPAA